MFCLGKSSTVSYGDSCFGVLEFCHISSCFTMCNVAPESAIILLLSCSWFDVLAINSLFYITSFVKNLQIIFPHFSSCINPFLRDWSFFNNWISSRYLCSCFYLVFIPWFSSSSIYWHVRVCQNNDILVFSRLLYAINTLNCAHISCKLCRYPCKYIFFFFSWISWYLLYVRSIKYH